MACLPWWHTQFAALGGKSRIRIRSGCSLSGGNIQCAPEKMRAAAQAKMRSLGHSISLSLAEYTVARYIASEVGSGTPEEKVAVAEAARNASKGNVLAQLLYRQPSGHPNRGYYGPIHGPEGTGTAPYRRWASTRAEPGVDDILIAQFVLTGESKNFAKGADDQIGMEYLPVAPGRATPAQSINYHARKRDYWVGPLPGVDHWHTFLYAHRPNVDPNSAQGRALVQRALAAVADRRRPDWSGLSVCKKSPIPWGTAIPTAIGLAASIYFTWRARRG